MKVTKTQIQPAFQPIELKITIESADELRVLKDITGAGCDTVHLLLNGGIIDSKRVALADRMLDSIYEAL